MSMALVDRAMRAEEFDEALQGPAQAIEFVLLHSDNVEAQGFVQHLKLPHYIDFQAELSVIRQLRQHPPDPESPADSDLHRHDFPAEPLAQDPSTAMDRQDLFVEVGA
jgi:alpha-D-ribose 1-methylphosphonate 5-triphosphate synthase subunit PhnI